MTKELTQFADELECVKQEDMKKALIVGIDNYLNISDLTGCVNDAHDVANVLTRNADGTLNFDVKVMTATSEKKYCNKK